VKLKTKAALAAMFATATITPATAVTITDYGGTLGALSYSVDLITRTISISETWTNATPVFLKISDIGNDPWTVIKTITNNTGGTFTSMANELLDPSGDGNDSLDPNPQPGFVPAGYSTSNDSDGLSFDQNGSIPRLSSVFTSFTADEFTDARDFIDFFNGAAAPGAVFTVQYGLIDTGGNQPFLLAQRFNVRSNVVPEPGTWALMIAGFGFAGMQLRRRRTVVSYA
jgi:PEP-CTERM motif